MPGNDREIGKVIQKARLAKKMTQETLSEITGVSLRTISNIENGKQHPRFDNLEKLVIALDIPRKLIVSPQNDDVNPDIELFISELRSASAVEQKLIVSSGRAIMASLRTQLRDENKKVKL